MICRTRADKKGYAGADDCYLAKNGETSDHSQGTTLYYHNHRVNGSGKTTTIGKLANLLKSNGHEVMLVAADTFRAAAIEQLEVWVHV